MRHGVKPSKATAESFVQPKNRNGQQRNLEIHSDQSSGTWRYSQTWVNDHLPSNSNHLVYTNEGAFQTIVAWMTPEQRSGHLNVMLFFWGLNGFSVMWSSYSRKSKFVEAKIYEIDIMVKFLTSRNPVKSSFRDISRLNSFVEYLQFKQNWFNKGMFLLSFLGYCQLLKQLKILMLIFFIFRI